MRLRESLIAFAHEAAGDAIVPEGEVRPKRSDFKGWAELLADAASPGPGGAEVRSYLRATARQAWDLVAWLTHAANAARSQAETAFDATGHVIGVFSVALIRAKHGELERCPACGSYRVVTEHLRDENGSLLPETYRLCETCHAAFDPPSSETAQ
jgi:hypothetical protein